MSAPSDRKAQLRRELKERLSGVTDEHQRRLLKQVRIWMQSQTGTWGSFWPLPGEPDLRPLWAEELSVQWVFPRIDQDLLHFHRAGEEDWVQGPFGIREPGIHSPLVEMSRIDGLLIPGLGFDKSGHRLGRGKGFYDRALANWNGLKVGVGFEIQWVTDVPVEAHDRNMDVIVTEAGPLRFR